VPLDAKPLGFAPPGMVERMQRLNLGEFARVIVNFSMRQVLRPARISLFCPLF